MEESVNKEIDASDLRIQVGVADNPVNPVKEVLGEDEDKAIRLIGDLESYITIDGGLWGVSEHEDGGVVEGPLGRDPLVAGLGRCDRVEIVNIEDTPLTGEVRSP